MMGVRGETRSRLQYYLGVLAQVGCGVCLLLPVCGWLAVPHGVFRVRCDAGTRGLVHVCSWTSLGFCGVFSSVVILGNPEWRFRLWSLVVFRMDKTV
jgi:hypothetical protein